MPAGIVTVTTVLVAVIVTRGLKASTVHTHCVPAIVICAGVDVGASGLAKPSRLDARCKRLSSRLALNGPTGPIASLPIVPWQSVRT